MVSTILIIINRLQLEKDNINHRHETMKLDYEHLKNNLDKSEKNIEKFKEEIEMKEKKSVHIMRDHQKNHDGYIFFTTFVYHIFVDIIESLKQQVDDHAEALEESLKLAEENAILNKQVSNLRISVINLNFLTK